MSLNGADCNRCRRRRFVSRKGIAPHCLNLPFHFPRPPGVGWSQKLRSLNDFTSGACVNAVATFHVRIFVLSAITPSMHSFVSQALMPKDMPSIITETATDTDRVAWNRVTSSAQAHTLKLCWRSFLSDTQYTFATLLVWEQQKDPVFSIKIWSHPPFVINVRGYPISYCPLLAW